jgi:DNA-binding NarL/FixJ family response regulator
LLNEKGKEKISVLIADDHPLFRKGIRLYLKDNNDIDLTKEVSNGEEALRYLEENIAKIDVIIMDLEMPKIDGGEATKEICKKWPDSKVLVMTSYGSWDKVHSLLDSGAKGYLLKDADPKELVIAIKAVYTGGSYFANEVATELLNRVQQKPEVISQDLIEPLTDRELEVLKLIGEGLGNLEIADQLHISNNTVKTHVSNIFQKLEVNSRTQAAFYAMQKGLV